MAVKGKGASVLVRLKTQAKEERIPLQMVLQIFAQEEFLRKLAMSRYQDNLVLKGGMNIYTLTEYHSRPTRDIDFLLRNLRGSHENVKHMMNDICGISTGNDFISMELLTTKNVTIGKEYPGVQVTFLGRIGNVRIPFSVDVGIDDVVVPSPIKRKICTRLPEFVSPEVLTYSLESTIAEKLDAIFQRMEGTSRMKDFYDIYYLSGLFDFDGSILQAAVRSTLQHRNRELYESVFDDIRAFAMNPGLLLFWKNFGLSQENNLSFEKVIQRLVDFLEPVYISIMQGSSFYMWWSSEKRLWKNIQ